MSKILTKEDVANLLQISIRSVDYFRANANLPFHVVGGKLVRFDEQEVLSWFYGKQPKTDSDATNVQGGGNEKA